jgi:HEAT repeat protein
MTLLLEIGRKHLKLATRRTAIRAIGRTGVAGYCDSLSSFLGQGSDSVILDAMVGRKDCQKSIVDPYLDDPDDDVRRRAFQLLVSTDPPGALAKSKSALGDNYFGVRQVASGFLRQSGQEAIPVLKAAMADTSRLRRSTALMTLGEIGHDGRAVLARSFGSSEWYDRIIAADGLGRIGGSQAVDSIESQILVETHPLVLVSLKRARTQALRERP